jgi:thiol-disulfide isomerase/thioredoxin
MTEGRLLWFWGRECPHCKQMAPILARLESEGGIKFEHLEVWHDQKNQELMRSHADVISAACGGQLGVPSFYNERNGKAICGMKLTYERIREWAEAP